MTQTSVQQTAGRQAFAAASRPRAVAASWSGAKGFAGVGSVSIDLATKPATHMYVDANHRVRRLREPSP